jgi:hypothetical protein
MKESRRLQTEVEVPGYHASFRLPRLIAGMITLAVLFALLVPISAALAQAHGTLRHGDSPAQSVHNVATLHRHAATAADGSGCTDAAACCVSCAGGGSTLLPPAIPMAALANAPQSIYFLEYAIGGDGVDAAPVLPPPRLSA